MVRHATSREPSHEARLKPAQPAEVAEERAAAGAGVRREVSKEKSLRLDDPLTGSASTGGPCFSPKDVDIEKSGGVGALASRPIPID